MTIPRRVRALVGDTDNTDYTYSHETVLDAILLAVPAVEADFYQGYTINDQGVISPTPDNLMETIVAYKAAIVLMGGTIVTSDRSGIYVKDGDTTIDTTKGGSQRLDTLKSMKDDYQNLIDRMIIEGTNTAGGIRGKRVDVYTDEEI